VKSLDQLASQLSRKFVATSIPLALLLSSCSSKAMLNANLFDGGSDPDVVSGSLSEPGTVVGVGTCAPNGPLDSISSTSICTSADVLTSLFSMHGSSDFAGNEFLLAAVSVWSPFLDFGANPFYAYAINPSYTAGQPFLGSPIFNGAYLDAQAFTTPGQAATSFNQSTFASIDVYFGPSSTEVPNPMPLFGAGAAFGWSRRLRRRTTVPVITPPQA
jgi:hypothetical protein